MKKVNKIKAVLQRLEIEDQELLLAYEFKEANFNVPLHFHPAYELVYIVKGTGMRYVGDKVESFVEGDMALIAPGLPHCWRNDLDTTSHCHSLVIQWSNFLVDDKPELNEVLPLLQDSKRGVRFTPKDKAELLVRLNNTIARDGLQRYIAFLELLYYLKNETDRSCISSHFEANKMTNVASDRLNKVYSFVEANYQNKITLAEVANLVNMTEEAFSRFFSKVLHRPFFAYLNEYRIHLACRLLQTKDVSVSEACGLCGFSSLPFFHRQFKKYKNISPLQFKKQFLKSLK